MSQKIKKHPCARRPRSFRDCRSTDKGNIDDNVAPVMTRMIIFVVPTANYILTKS